MTKVWTMNEENMFQLGEGFISTINLEHVATLQVSYKMGIVPFDPSIASLIWYFLFQYLSTMNMENITWEITGPSKMEINKNRLFLSFSTDNVNGDKGWKLKYNGKKADRISKVDYCI